MQTAVDNDSWVEMSPPSDLLDPDAPGCCGIPVDEDEKVIDGLVDKFLNGTVAVRVE